MRFLYVTFSSVFVDNYKNRVTSLYGESTHVFTYVRLRACVRVFVSQKGPKELKLDK